MPDHPQAEDLFARAYELSGEARETFLADACGGNAELHCRVQELLAAALKADSFFGDTSGDGLRSPVVMEACPEREGDQIGPYTLRQQIGEGGFGLVWMAEQSEPISRMVALKVIKAGMDTKQVLARFEAERQALAMMDHPNIARVLDAGATPSGRPWFAMELVKGVPITQFCDEQGLSIRDRLVLFNDVCSAISHAHLKGVIHRDIKPSNVMVTRHDDKAVVKVIDFGIAKATGCRLTDRTLFTRFEQMIGTPIYMSPEQAGLSGLDIDTRSDIYALGVLLYELLAGQPPFDAESLLSAGYEEMRRIIREVEPVKPSSRISTLLGEERALLARSRRFEPEKLDHLIEPDLDWVVMKAIEKDRTRRYETAGAFAQDIARFLADEPVSAGPPSAAYRVRKFVRRNRRGLLSGATAVVALVAGLAVAAGIWVNATLDKNERVSRAADLIGQAEQCLERNAVVALDEDSHFNEACELLRRADEALSGIKHPDDSTLERHGQLRRMLAEEASARMLVATIEETVMKTMAKRKVPREESQAMINELAKAFADFGITPHSSPVEDTVKIVVAGRKELQDRILAGLSAWAEAIEETDAKQAARLEEIIDRADTDPWRRELRQAITAGDAVVLEALADRKEISEQPVMTVLQLSSALEDKQLADAVEKLLRRAQQEAPTNFWTNYLLGCTLAGDIDRERDSDVRDKIYKVGFDAGSGPPGLIQKTNQVRPEFDEAAGFLRAAVAARPDAEEAWLMLGVTLAAGGHSDEAFHTYQRAATWLPYESSLLDSLLGQALCGRNQHKEALPYVRRAVEKDPKNDGRQFLLGLTLAALGEYEEARAALLQSVKLVAEQARGEGEAPKLDALGKETELNEEMAHLIIANTQRCRGDSEAALASIQLALEANPNSALACFLHGMMFCAKGELQEAKDSAQRMLELEPELAQSHNLHGITLMGERKFNDAIASFRRALELDPKDPTAHCNLGTSLGELGKYEEAISSIETAIDLAPEYALAWNNLGALSRHRGNLEEAMEYFRKAASFDPGNITPASKNIANTLWQLGKHEESITAYRQLDDADAYNSLCWLLEEEQRPGEAIEVLERAIELKPDLAMTHYNLGTIHLRAGRPNDAVTPLRTATRLQPEMHLFQHQLGCALLCLGQYDEAFESFRQAFSQQPNSMQYQYALTSALLCSGRIMAAGQLHGTNSCKDPRCAIEELLKMDAQLREILKNDGADSAEIPPLLGVMSGKFYASVYAASLHLPSFAAERRAIWESRREEIARRLSSASVRLIQIRKQGGKHPEAGQQDLKAIAAGIMQQLNKGGDFAELAKHYSEGWARGRPQSVAYGELTSNLNMAAFSIEEGEFTRQIIEDEHGFYLLKVESRQAGKAVDFENPKVQGTIEGMINEQRCKDWEQRYLARVTNPAPDLITATAQDMAGLIFMDAGQYHRAADLFQQAVATKKAILGEEDHETLLARNNMAIAYSKTGRLDEALKIQEQVLALRRSVSGPEHAATLTAMGNLADTYIPLGRMDEAMRTLEEVVALRRKADGPQHPLTLRAINNLARCYYEGDRKDEALKMMEEVLGQMRKVLGPEHPDTLMAMNNLAVSLYDAGQRDEAITTLEEVLMLRRKVSGPEHPDTLLTLNNLANFYRDAGRQDELIKLIQEHSANHSGKQSAPDSPADPR